MANPFLLWNLHRLFVNSEVYFPLALIYGIQDFFLKGMSASDCCWEEQNV